jgi:hypothetical protein
MRDPRERVLDMLEAVDRIQTKTVGVEAPLAAHEVKPAEVVGRYR